MFLPRKSLMLTVSVRQGNMPEYFIWQKEQLCISSSGKQSNSEKGQLNIFNGVHSVNPLCWGAVRLCVKAFYTHLGQNLQIKTDR